MWPHSTEGEATNLSVTPGIPHTRCHSSNMRACQTRTRAHFRAYCAGTTCRLLVTEKIPGTLLARRVTRFLSASLSTTPSKVT